MGMIVGTKIVLDENKYTSPVSNGFIPDSFFDHFDLDAYTLPMFNVEEVLETTWDSPMENNPYELLEISTVITPKQVAATEVLNPVVNLNPSFSSSNDSEISCDVNLKS
jgi:hypothetical protein